MMNTIKFDVNDFSSEHRGNFVIFNNHYLGHLNDTAYVCDVPYQVARKLESAMMDDAYWLRNYLTGQFAYRFIMHQSNNYCQIRNDALDIKVQYSEYMHSLDVIVHYNDLNRVRHLATLPIYMQVTEGGVQLMTPEEGSIELVITNLKKLLDIK